MSSGAKFLWSRGPCLYWQALKLAWEREEAIVADQAAFQPSLTHSLSCDR